MTTSEFLDDLERRIEETWTDEETLRLWQVHGSYRIPPPGVRQVYARQTYRRLEIIAEARAGLIGRALKALDQ